VTARVVALAGDLLDQSRIRAAMPGVAFVRSADECAGADVVVVDLARHLDAVARVREVATDARIVAFGPHVDDHAARAADAAGADLVLPRSRFFRDPRAAVERL
jgi:hypothetical protein